MRVPPFQIGRRLIHFSDHAEERYLQRSGVGRLGMRRDFETARWERRPPRWAVLSQWHRARFEGALMLDEDRGFIVNKIDGTLLAVSFIVRTDGHPDADGRPDRATRPAVAG